MYKEFPVHITIAAGVKAAEVAKILRHVIKTLEEIPEEETPEVWSDGREIIRR